MSEKLCSIKKVGGGIETVFFQYPANSGYYIDGSTQHVLQHDTNKIYMSNWNNSGTGDITCNGTKLKNLAIVTNYPTPSNAGYGCYSATYEYAFKAGDVIEIPNSNYYAYVWLIY